MDVYSVINNKGGVAKTVTAVSCASMFAERGYKTLLIDLDQQGNATSFLDISLKDNSLTIYDLYFENKSIDEVAQQVGIKGLEKLYVVPSNSRFVSAISKILTETRPDQDNILKRKLAKSTAEYDVVFIDCPPALDKLVITALMATTNVIIPTTPDKFSLDGMSRIRAFISECEPYMDNFKGDTLLITKKEKNRNISDAIVNQILSQDFLNVFDVMIPKGIVVDEAIVMKKPLNIYQPQSHVTIAYSKVVDLLVRDLVQQ